MDISELTWWYWLESVKGLGPAYTRSLLDAVGTARNVYEASQADLKQLVKLPARTWSSLEKSKDSLPAYETFAERQIRMARAIGARIVTLQDPDYPEFLRNQHKQAPPLIHVQGNLELVRPRSVAVVGTRSPSQEALQRAGRFSHKMSQNGHSIVAGMARGVDTVAHKSALEGCGSTIGVLGCGLDRVYPPENAPLFVETRQRGLLLSQFPFGAAPSPDNLRQRNKLIVALAEAVVIAESDVKGGAMISARAAVDQGRNLLAFRWPQMEMPSRAGTGRLLEKRLARSVVEGDDPTIFASPIYRESDIPPAKLWKEAFPSSSRGLNNSGRRRGPSAESSARGHNPATKTPPAGQTTARNRA